MATRYKAAERAASVSDADKWIANWAVVYHADLWVETDPDRAEQLIKGLAQRIDVGEDEEDNELRVHLTWLYGDLAWSAGDQPRAFDSYARAALHAFVFHVRQVSYPQNPDKYTVSIYQLILDRIRRRLDEARADGLNEVADAALIRTRGLFAPYWEHVRTVPDNDGGFPPQARETELNRLKTPFAGNVMWVIDNMSEQLSAPLDAPLHQGN